MLTLILFSFLVSCSIILSFEKDLSVCFTSLLLIDIYLFLAKNIEQEVIHEKKKARNIGSKSKRLHMHCEDAMELKFTWEEMQEFLRPPPSIKPTVVMIENCELEEYNVSISHKVVF